MSQLSTPMWVFDVDSHKIWWANESGLKFWRASSNSDLSARDFSSDSLSVRDRLASVVDPGASQTATLDTWTLYPDGTAKSVMLSMQPVKIEDNRDAILIEMLQEFTSVAEDVSLRLIEAVRGTALMITTVSLDGRIMDQNPAAFACYGILKSDEAESNYLSERFVNPTDVKRILDAASSNTAVTWKAPVHTLQGPKTHLVSTRRARDPLTAEPTVLISEEDITELAHLYDQQISKTKRLEDVLAKSSGRLRMFEDRIQRALQVAAIWDWDIATDRLFFSENFVRLLGYEPDEFRFFLRENRFEGIVQPDDYRAHTVMLKRILENPHKPISMEMRFVTKSGDLLWFQVEGKCFCDAAGVPKRTAGLLTNITVKKQLEQQLLTSQRLEAIGQLTGGIAHDFNNLLTVIQGNVQLLEEIGEIDKGLIGEIERAVRSGADLTRHLLAFARKQSLNPKAVSVTSLVDEMYKTLLRILSETVDITINGQDGLWRVYADGAQTEAAILNVALNARDAMPNGGELTIRCENVMVKAASNTPLTTGEYVKISVTDTGTGMSPEDASRAVEPFFTTKEVGKGSGLGLSMVLGFSRQSGGDLQITSLLGEGTTVSIFLPRADQNAQQDIPAVAPAISKGNGEHVHILEDDLQVQRALSKLTHSLGYKISTSSEADEALEAARKHTDISVFLIDVVLPGGKSGVDFALEVLEQCPEAKLILMSGYPKSHLMHDITKEMNFQFLPKPFDRTALSKALSAGVNADAS